jgi:enterochelin esterase family protein
MAGGLLRNALIMSAFLVGCTGSSKETMGGLDGGPGPTGGDDRDVGSIPSMGPNDSGDTADSTGSGASTSLVTDTGAEAAPVTTTDASPAVVAPQGEPDSSLLNPGPTGNGDRTIGPTFTPAPETMVEAGVPKGHVISFMLPTGTIYPLAPTRNVRVYVPSQYVSGTPAPLMVVQDGMDSFYDFVPLLSTVLDNSINAKMVPTLVVVFPDNGGGDSVGSERGLEYDTVSGLYAEWADQELLPAAEAATMAQLPSQAVTFTHDPQGRGTMGGSSGGAASFSMAWWHPDLFNRVLTFSGTFVNQVPANSPFPHGCWVYHDVDPYDAGGPNGLIVQDCQNAAGFVGASAPGPCDTPLSMASCQAVGSCAWNTTVNRPLRMWLESGTNDDGAGQAPSTYRNFDLANQRMAASLQMRGYPYHYDHALGAGHVDQGVVHQTIAEALIWLWGGYPIGQ